MTENRWKTVGKNRWAMRKWNSAGCLVTDGGKKKADISLFRLFLRASTVWWTRNHHSSIMLCSFLFFWGFFFHFWSPNNCLFTWFIRLLVIYLIILLVRYLCLFKKSYILYSMRLHKYSPLPLNISIQYFVDMTSPGLNITHKIAPNI